MVIFRPTSLEKILIKVYFFIACLLECTSSEGMGREYEYIVNVYLRVASCLGMFFSTDGEHDSELLNHSTVHAGKF